MSNSPRSDDLREVSLALAEQIADLREGIKEVSAMLSVGRVPAAIVALKELAEE